MKTYLFETRPHFSSEKAKSNRLINEKKQQAPSFPRAPSMQFRPSIFHFQHFINYWPSLREPSTPPFKAVQFIASTWIVMCRGMRRNEEKNHSFWVKRRRKKPKKHLGQVLVRQNELWFKVGKFKGISLLVQYGECVVAETMNTHKNAFKEVPGDLLDFKHIL